MDKRSGLNGRRVLMFDMYQLKIQGDVHKKVERIRTAKIPTLGTPGRHQQRTYICVEAIPIEIVDVELRCCFRIKMNYNALQGTIKYPTLGSGKSSTQK